MSSEEFNAWQDYYLLEPFGAWRDNWHASQIAALIYNTSRGKNQRPVKTFDFMYADPESAAEAKDKELLGFFSAAAAKNRLKDEVK